MLRAPFGLESREEKNMEGWERNRSHPSKAPSASTDGEKKGFGPRAYLFYNPIHGELMVFPLKRWQVIPTPWRSHSERTLRPLSKHITFHPPDLFLSFVFCIQSKHIFVHHHDLGLSLCALRPFCFDQIDTSHNMHYAGSPYYAAKYMQTPGNVD